MTNFSVTERGTFKRCRRRWNYASMNMMNLEPVLKSPALALGTLIHKVLPAWANGKDPLDEYLTASAQLLIDISMHYQEIIGLKPSDNELEPIIEAIDLGRAMITRYVDYYKTPIPQGLYLVAAEQTITVDVPGTEHCKCLAINENQEPGAGTTGCHNHELDCAYCSLYEDHCIKDKCSCVECHKLEATLDGILRDEYDNYYVLEHKTYDRRPNDQELGQNDQFLAYMWAIKHALPEPVSVRGVAYNGLWKRKEIPKGKTLDDMFLRKTLLRSQAELDEFSRFLPLELNDMAYLSQHPELAYKTVPPVGGCWDCTGFRNLCNAESRGEDLTFLLKNYTHRESYYSEDDPSAAE